MAEGVDYAALAEQARNSDAPPVDYAALAAQARSGSAAGATAIPGMEKLGGTPPAAPKPPLPADLDPNWSAPSTFVNPRTGKRGTNMAPGKQGGPLGILDNPVTGIQKIGEGVSQMADANAAPITVNGVTKDQTTPIRQIAGGASKVLRGGMEAATPLLPGAAAAAPARLAAGLAAGTLAGKAAHGALSLAGAPGEVADLGEDVAGIAAGTKAAKSGPEVVTGAKTAISEKLARDPIDSMTRAIKPRSANIGFAENLNRSMPELKATETETGKPITNIADLLSSIKAAKQRVWGQYEAMAGPQAKAQLDTSGVADAMISTIPDRTRAQNPGLVQGLEAKAETYRRPMTVQQIEDNLQHVNAELNAYYAKYPAARSADLSKNPDTAAIHAEGVALRKKLYDWIDQDAGGAAPREIKKRYGALTNLEEEAYRRQNVADRQQPDSLPEQIGKWSGYGEMAKGGLKLLTGQASGAADIAGGVARRQGAKWLKDQQTTDSLIRDAFSRFSGTPTPVQSPAPFQPKGLLGAGDVITPPPLDRSSVRSVPAMAQPPNPARALPQAPNIRITPPPADTSGVRSTGGPPLRAPISRQLRQGPSRRSFSDLSGQAGDVTDTVPVRNPTTGEIEFIPRYAKGGIIHRKTILSDAKTGKVTGMMAEAGPEAIVPIKGRTADVPTVPEKADAIAEQLGQLADLKRRVVMIPRGTFPHAPPQGMVTHADQSGNRFIFNPNLIGIHDIKVAIAANRLPAILGAARGGMGAPDKSKLRGAVANVAAKSPNGFTVQSTATDKPHLKISIQQSRKILPKGGTVSVESPGKEIARRLRP